MPLASALLAALVLLAGCGGGGEPAAGGEERPSAPAGLEPLPAPVAGEPLYPRPGGRLYFGLTDNALNEGTATPEQIAALVAGAGGAFVRLDLFWPGVERGAGNDDWSRYDEQYAAFLAAGVRPLWTVLSTPAHAARPGVRCDGNFCSGEPADRGVLRRFARRLAARYPLAAGFEYRNEPNLDADQRCSEEPAWHVAPDAYVASLAAFADGVRAGAPAMRVLGGALSNCPLGDRAPRYLAAMLEEGAAGHVDAISWHPYDETQDQRLLRFQTRAFADVLRRAGREDLRLAAGEVGVNGDGPLQSSRMQRLYTAFDQRDGAIALAGSYDLFAAFVTVEKRDAGTRGYGWVRPGSDGFAAKAVYCDFRDLLGVTRPLPAFLTGCG